MRRGARCTVCDLPAYSTRATAEDACRRKGRPVTAVYRCGGNYHFHADQESRMPKPGATMRQLRPDAIHVLRAIKAGRYRRDEALGWVLTGAWADLVLDPDRIVRRLLMTEHVAWAAGQLGLTAKGVADLAVADARVLLVEGQRYELTEQGIAALDGGDDRG